jgi:hypothetical protein
LKKKRIFLIPIRYWAETRLETESGPAAIPFPHSSATQLKPACPSKHPRPSQWLSLPLPSSPSVPTRDEPKRRLRAPYEILTKSEPNWIKVGMEIEFNLPARSPTEKPYKKVPRWPSNPSNSAATLTSLPAVVAPLRHLPPNRSLVEHRRNSAVPLECTPS